MFKNTASQKLVVFAFDATTNLPKSGDAANITAYVSKDYGTVTVLGDTSATEMDATNAKGYYLFDLTQAETNADTLLFSAKSSTSNVVVIGVPAAVFTAPANFTALSITAGGVAQADVRQFRGDAVLAPDLGSDGYAANFKQLFGVNVAPQAVFQSGCDSAIAGRFTFTVSRIVDANIQYVNDVQVGGAGTSGNPWGPA